ncbi:MAG: DNA polymerase [Planctomycetes bacterium]|nr:DNA polymerase [Planctomycetota bacterium]NOG53766.1 DNA polymerase [Planctomycetota bacterium]
MLTTLFLDMNAYFASVEQQDKPELRGKPIGVVPVMAESSCCIAASYEAKRFGVKTGCSVRDAKRLCPNITLIEGNPERYIEVHHQIVATVESCLPVDGVHSIDEMSCRLMGTEREVDRAVDIAHLMKDRIRDQVGRYLRCSVGIAPNRFLSKVATEIEKPDGLVVIQLSDLPDKLHPLELSDLPGIGRRMLIRLNQHGIMNVEQLCQASEDHLIDVWQSVIGRIWWHWLRGHELKDPPVHRRTVGHSHVLPPEHRSADGARAVLIRLIQKAGARLRDLGYWAKRLHILVIYMDGPKWKATASLGLCQDTTTMIEVFSRQWDARPHTSCVPLKVGMRLDDLTENRQAPIPLFPGERKRVRLARAIDDLNGRFGRHTVYFASMHHTRAAAPIRIAFGNIPDLELQA